MIRSTAIAAAALAGGMMLAPMPATAGGINSQIRPCHYEDGSGQQICLWNAGVSGNGIGDSFIAIHGGTDRSRYIYISARIANRLSH